MATIQLSGPLCKAARALTEISRKRLSQATGLDEDTISSFERGLSAPDADKLAAIRDALEDFGAVFILEDKRGHGVRLKFTKADARRIATLEAEGGPARSDDVP